MTVYGEVNLSVPYLGDFCFYQFNQRPELIGHCVAHRIGYIDSGCPVVDCSLYHLEEKVLLRTGGVFRGNLDSVKKLSSVIEIFRKGLKYLGAVFFQLVLAMKGTGSNKKMQHWIFRILQGVPGCVDVYFYTSRKTNYRRPLQYGRDPSNSFKLHLRRDGKSRFDDIHTEVFKGLGHFNLLFKRHG